MSLDKIDAERVRALIEYDPETGLLRWRVARPGTWRRGWFAGTHQKARGYLTVWCGNRKWLVHRLAWVLMTGSLPPDEIDHINGNRIDNRWSNLRPATTQQNCVNRRSRGSSGGLRGVYLQRGRYRAILRAKGHNHHLGYYATPEEAHAAYCDAARQHFGEFARTA